MNEQETNKTDKTPIEVATDKDSCRRHYLSYKYSSYDLWRNSFEKQKKNWKGSRTYTNAL